MEWKKERDLQENRFSYHFKVVVAFFRWGRFVFIYLRKTALRCWLLTLQCVHAVYAVDSDFLSLSLSLSLLLQFAEPFSIRFSFHIAAFWHYQTVQVYQLFKRASYLLLRYTSLFLLSCDLKRQQFLNARTNTIKINYKTNLNFVSKWQTFFTPSLRLVRIACVMCKRRE